jgi:hypothetical protein
MVVLTSGVSVPAESKENACFFIVEHCNSGLRRRGIGQMDAVGQPP